MHAMCPDRVFRILNSPCCGIFFFQAEDGIRDPLWSRGLGDVYKRQNLRLLLRRGSPDLFLCAATTRCATRTTPQGALLNRNG